MANWNVVVDVEVKFRWDSGPRCCAQ